MDNSPNMSRQKTGPDQDLYKILKEIKGSVGRVESEVRDCKEELDRLKRSLGPSKNSLLASPTTSRRPSDARCEFNTSKTNLLASPITNKRQSYVRDAMEIQITPTISQIGMCFVGVNTFKKLDKDRLRLNLAGLEHDQIIKKLQGSVNGVDVETTVACLLLLEGQINKVINCKSCTGIGKTWLQFMILNWPDQELSSLLIELGVDQVDMSWCSAQQKNYLHLAAERGHAITLGILLFRAKSQGILAHLTETADFTGYHPVHYSALVLSEPCLSAFISAGTCVTQINKKTGVTVLTLIGNSVEMKGSDQQHKYQAMLRLLLKNNLLDTKIINTRPMLTDGMTRTNTPLHHAVVYGTKQDVEALVQLGAFPERAEDDKSPLFLAAEMGKGLVLELLLNHFASGRRSVDIDLPDKEGNTCLHAAVKRCRTQESARTMVEGLVHRGAQLARPNSVGQTPLDLMFECIQHPGEFISGLFSMRVNEAMKVLDIKDKKGLKGALSALMKSEEETQQKQIRFDYQDLNPASGGSRGSADKRNLVLANLLTNIKRNSEEGDKILMHPLTESFILLKWRNVQRAFLFQFFLTFALVCLYTVFITNRCDNTGILHYGDRHEINTYIILALMIPLILEIFLFEVVLWGYYWQSAIAACFLVTAIVSMCKPFVCEKTWPEVIYTDIAAFSGLFAWLYMFIIAGIHPKIGTFSIVFVKVARRLTLLICAYFPILFGFTVGFSLVLPEKKIFSNVATRVNTVLGMLMGELALGDNFPMPEDSESSENPECPNIKRFNTVLNMLIEKLKLVEESQESQNILEIIQNVFSIPDIPGKNISLNLTEMMDNMETDTDTTPWTTMQYSSHVMFLLFIFSCSIVVFNVLTAFAIKDVEAVLTKAEKNKLLRQAEYVSLLETSFLGRFIDLRIDKNLVDKKYLIVVPGLGQDRRCNFDKKTVEKWFLVMKKCERKDKIK